MTFFNLNFNWLYIVSLHDKFNVRVKSYTIERILKSTEFVWLSGYSSTVRHTLSTQLNSKVNCPAEKKNRVQNCHEMGVREKFTIHLFISFPRIRQLLLQIVSPSDYVTVYLHIWKIWMKSSSLFRSVVRRCFWRVPRKLRVSYIVSCAGQGMFFKVETTRTRAALQGRRLAVCSGQRMLKTETFPLDLCIYSFSYRCWWWWWGVPLGRWK